MNRRVFLTASTSFAVASPLLLSVGGCTTSTVVNEINVVLTEAANILVVAEPNATWVPQLQAAIAALKTAEASWTAGGTVTEVINALNTIEAITAVIPLTSTYSPLIDVLVAGIEAILAALPAQPSAAVKAVQNPHIGRVKIRHSLFHSRVDEFKKAWNEAAESNPKLAGATLK
jgi:hypothetical protein